MKAWMWVMLCSGALVLTAVGGSSDDHRALSSTACWAVGRDNVDLLRALLQAGVQINEPVCAGQDDDTGRTLLHLAAAQNRLRVIEFLRDNGASLSVRDRAGDRPIDLAYRDNYTNACDVLSQPDMAETLVGEVPEDVLKEVIRIAPRQEVTFLTFNGADAPKELMDWFRKTGWPKIRSGSESELSDAADGQEGQIRDRKTKETGLLLKIAVKKTKTGYDWGVVLCESPWSSDIQSGGLIKRYGYWIRVNVKGLES